MTRGQRWLLRILVVLGHMLLGDAWAAVSCSMSGTTINQVYVTTANTDGNGTLTINCSRLATDPATANLIVSMAPNRTLARDVGAQTLNYTVYSNMAGGTQFTNVLVTMNFGTQLTASQIVPYYTRVGSAQNQPVGVYSDANPVTLSLFTFPPFSTTQLATTTLNMLISIRSICRLGSPAVTLPIAYTAFSAAQSASTTFKVTCTLGTPYTLALDANSGVFPSVMLAYTAALSATVSSGSATAQPYTVTVTIGPQQAGNCSSSMCTDTVTRQVMISW